MSSGEFAPGWPLIPPPAPAEQDVSAQAAPPPEPSEVERFAANLHSAMTASGRPQRFEQPPESVRSSAEQLAEKARQLITDPYAGEGTVQFVQAQALTAIALVLTAPDEVSDGPCYLVRDETTDASGRPATNMKAAVARHNHLAAAMAASIALGISAEEDWSGPSIKPGTLTAEQVDWLASWLVGDGWDRTPKKAGPTCGCGNPAKLDTVHRADGPCYSARVDPTIEQVWRAAWDVCSQQSGADLGDAFASYLARLDRGEL